MTLCLQSELEQSRTLTPQDIVCRLDLGRYCRIPHRYNAAWHDLQVLALKGKESYWTWCKIVSSGILIL